MRWELRRAVVAATACCVVAGPAAAEPLTRDAVYQAAKRGQSARQILRRSFPDAALRMRHDAVVRILVADMVPEVIVAGQSPLRLVDEGRPARRGRRLLPSHRYRIVRTATGFSYSDLDGPRPAAALVGPVRIDAGPGAAGIRLAEPVDRRYRRSLRILPGDGSSMMVVNQLGIEQYLRGVLPGDMPPAWGKDAPQALQAGAIVERTDALARRKLPASPYDLTADDPLYLGVDGESATTTQAIRASRWLSLTRDKHSFEASFPTTTGGPIAFAPSPGAPALVAETAPAEPIGGARPGLGPAALQAALGFQGTPYLWGGSAPGGFDCSGLVFYVFGQLGIDLPRVAEDQAHVGVPVTRDRLAPGDAVFFADSSGYIHHEGLYVGNGMFVHAPHTGDVVRTDSLASGYYARQYAGARRYSP